MGQLQSIRGTDGDGTDGDGTDGDGTDGDTAPTGTEHFIKSGAPSGTE